MCPGSIKRLRVVWASHHAAHTSHWVHAATHCWGRLWLVGNDTLGRENKRSDRCSVLQCCTSHLGGVDNASLDEIGDFACGCVEADGPRLNLNGLNHD